MSVTPGITPETLTFDEIKKWSGQEMKDQMRRSDEMRAAVYKIITSRSLDEVQTAQAQIDANNPPAEAVVSAEEAAATEQQRLAAEAEAQAAVARETARQAAEAAENEQLRAAGIAVVRDQYGNISKLIQDYQVDDEHGNPIGRPTHLEARSWPELVAKQKEAHSQATRAFHRLKSQKISFKEQPVVSAQQTDAELLEAMKDLRSDDPKKQLDAIRKVQQAEADKKDAEAKEYRRQQEVSRRFLERHKSDFNNCKANIELVKEYFEQNPELAWTDDNLEICLHALESRLAPVESVAPTVTVNPVPAAPVVAPAPPVAAPVTVQPTASPAVQPGTTVPAQVIPAANPQAITPRPGVNGGLIPGETSASRPGPTKPKKLTAEEVRSWSPEQMKKNMRDSQIRPLIEEFVRERNQGRR